MRAMAPPDALCRLTASQQSRLLAAREVSSRELVQAHLDRIGAVDPRLHAFCAVFPEQALAGAAESDARRARGAARGPLEGLPVSIKECLDWQGLAVTLGLPGRVGHRAPADAAVLTLVREAGAVPLGRTNNPQLLVSYETRNPLYGQTNNPWSLQHAPGGSSGGESAALAAGLSPLGLGTDLGGSIRVPAHFTGTAGLKPTLDRWPMRGANTGMPGQEAVRGMAGPMARTTADLVLMMGAFEPRRLTELDGRTPPLPWQDPARIALDRLRVGVVRGALVVQPSPAVARAVEEAAGHLRAAGCAVEEFELPEALDLVARYSAALTADGGATFRERLRGGAVDENMRALLRQVQVPNALRRVLGALLERRGDVALARVFRKAGQRTLPSFYKLTDEIRGARGRFLDALAARRLDLLLLPPFATPAVPHLASGEFLLGGAWSMLFNLLQLPAGVVPVTRVRADETSPARSALRLEAQAARIDARSAGLPVGVQVVGRPWEEHLVLAAMQAVEERARAAPGFPHTPVDPA